MGNNKKVRDKYALKETDFVVLYAPTYRGPSDQPYFTSRIDVDVLKRALGEKFKKDVKICFRGHYYFEKESGNSKFDRDFSDYPDMQELLCATDMLITDYSSSMWDYSFLYRPCFLFVPDLNDYIESRGFYTDPYSWGFPICRSNEELADKIEKFDEAEFTAAVKKNHEDFGSYEDGVATEKIVGEIFKES